jgi:IclR family mhp operon transcriptional activator
VDRLVKRIRRLGYVSRARHVEAKNSNTVAVPIMNEAGRVVAGFGLSYFTAGSPRWKPVRATYR